MRFALLTLAVLGSVGQATEPKTEVARLSSRSFAEREAAAKSLEEFGTSALPELRKALAEDSDAEVQLRAADLIDRIQRRAEMIRLTRGQPVALDYKDRPLDAAIIDLRAKLGIPLVLHPSVKAPGRLITVVSGELPPWQALEKFCAAAGLMEQLKPDAKAEIKAPLRTDRRKKVRFEEADDGPGMGAQSLGGPGDVPVTLVDGQSSPPADCRTGIRVRALPMSYLGSGIDRGLGELTLNLDVAPQAESNWVNTTEIRIGKASTVAGLELQTVWKPDRVATSRIFFSQSDMGRAKSLEAALPARTNPRVLPVTFKMPQGEVKSLAKLEGLVLGEILAANQTLVEMDNIVEGAEGAGPQGSTLTVVSMTTDPKSKALSMVLRTSSSSAVWESARRTFGNFESLLNSESFSKLVFQDADGKLVPHTCTYKINKGDGIRVIFEGTIQFHAGIPAKLVLMGTKLVSVALPFQLKDVPLE